MARVALLLFPPFLGSDGQSESNSGAWPSLLQWVLRAVGGRVQVVESHRCSSLPFRLLHAGSGRARAGRWVTQSPEQGIVRVPAGYPSSLIYMDESGAASNDRFFVIGALKVRRHGEFARAVRHLRDQTGFRDEFKFNTITHAKLPVFYGLADLLSSLKGLHFAACVVDRTLCDPFGFHDAKWRGHLDVAAQLLRGAIYRKEMVSVCMDVISTPPGVAFEDELKRAVNSRFRNLSVVTAAALDSRTCDGLQVVDLLAGALAFDRRRAAGLSGAANSNKAKVVDRVKLALQSDFSDHRSPGINIATYKRGPRRLAASPGAGPEPA